LTYGPVRGSLNPLFSMDSNTEKNNFLLSSHPKFIEFPSTKFKYIEMIAFKRSILNLMLKRVVAKTKEMTCSFRNWSPNAILRVERDWN